MPSTQQSPRPAILKRATHNRAAFLAASLLCLSALSALAQTTSYFCRLAQGHFPRRKSASSSPNTLSPVRINTRPPSTTPKSAPGMAR